MDEKIPLFIVTGASGTGKTTVIKELRGLLPDVDIFDIDSIHTFVGRRLEKNSKYLASCC